ncbi:hypothetical protein, partial [Klebsiella aerogenes]|uniref:hypothetical protein n=1 Tax=Klebsiella aerogenes TaxID=548 RepID=UPI002FF62218
RLKGRFRVRAPLFKEPAQKAGFCFSATGLSIELRSIIRRNAAHPFGASATSALFNACGVSPSPGTNYSENPAYGWVFAFLQPDSPSNCVRLFAANTTALKLMNDLLQNTHVSLVQYPFIPTHF